MAAYTDTSIIPGTSRLTRAARTTVAAVTFAARVAARPHRAAVGNLLHMPFTAAGAACIDYAAFHIGSGWGWLTTGISLIIVEHLIADEQ